MFDFICVLEEAPFSVAIEPSVAADTLGPSLLLSAILDSNVSKLTGVARLAAVAEAFKVSSWKKSDSFAVGA